MYAPLFLFVFLFLEFINDVCGLRWMRCGGAAAYYVECTNVVRKWYGSDCVDRGYQGRRGWFFKLGCGNFTSIMSCDIISVEGSETEIFYFKQK